MNDKSVNELLIEHPHLAHAVSLLIRGCQDGESGYRMLAAWDEIRQVKLESARSEPASK